MEQLTYCQKLNRENIVKYFRDSCKSDQTLGFELEHVLLHEDGRPVSYSEPGGVRDVLTRLAPSYKKVFYEDGNIVSVARSYEVVTIEPAGQIEVSLGPYRSVVEMEKAYLAFRNSLDPILEEFGLMTPMLGYNPSSCARDLELVPKYRYACMTDFLGAQAYEGICMMRGTSSLQVSIDFRNEADAEFDTSMLYELPAIRYAVETALQTVPASADEYKVAEQLLYYLSFFEGLEASFIPRTSILREFIGGSQFNVA